jgi:hypothetical protein
MSKGEIVGMFTGRECLSSMAITTTMMVWLQERKTTMLVDLQLVVSLSLMERTMMENMQERKISSDDSMERSEA